MKRALVVVGLLLGGFLALAIITATPLVGEVVTLESLGPDGEWHSTPLWIVDAPDGTYLRAGTPEGSGWVTRVQANPEVRLERSGEFQEARLVANPALRDAINQQMAEKYGWANSFVSLMGNHAAALPFRVEANSASASP
jgi:hypothetical protein